MTRLAERLASLEPPPGAIACAWIGQSGYVLRDRNVTVIVDPYLSDYAQESLGVERMFPPPISPEELVPDVLLITHSDLDHLDLPTVRTYAEKGQTFLLAPETTVTRARARGGWPAELAAPLRPGESATVSDTLVRGTFARHSDADLLTRDSMGFVVELDGLAVWHSGDTEYDSRLRKAAPGRIDLALLPINGTGGNMNAHEAALLAWQMDVRCVVPMHYGMWAADDYTYQGLEPDATLDPQTFVETYRRLGGSGDVLVLEVGEVVVLSRAQSGTLAVERQA